MITTNLFSEDFEALEDFGDAFGYNDGNETVYTWFMDNGNWNLAGPADDCAPPGPNDSSVAYFGDEWSCNYGWYGSDYLEMATPITLPDDAAEVTLSFDSYEDLDCDPYGGGGGGAFYDNGNEVKVIGLASPLAGLPHQQDCDITDLLLVEIGVYNGDYWEWDWLAEMDNNGGGWYRQTIPLPDDYLGQAIKLRFSFETDGYEHQALGWMIDNVVLESLVPASRIAPMTFTWDLADGTSLTTSGTPALNNGSVVTHTYEAGGIYTVVVTGSNAVISALPATTTVLVDEPIVGLTIVDESPAALAQPTTLTATATQGTNMAYTWDLGDGAQATGPVVTHTYLYPRTYLVALTATNTTGVETASTNVIVGEPLADLTVTINDSPILAGQTVLLTTTAGLTSVIYSENFETLDDLGDGFGYDYGEGGQVYTWLNNGSWSLQGPTDVCLPPGPNNTTIAYFGNEGCNYSWVDSDGLEMADPITLPVASNPTLFFSSYESLDCDQGGGGGEASIEPNKVIGLASPLADVSKQGCIYDWPQVEIGTYNGDYWQWDTVAELTGNEGRWNTHHLSLADYEGQAIKLRFYFNGDYGEHYALGWMIDDVTIMGRVQATIEDEITYSWSFDDGTLAPDSGPSVAHAYDSGGTYPVVVTASNAVSLITETVYALIVDPIELAISKDGPEIAASGQPFTYTLTVTNTGQDLATNLVVSDTLPPGAAYVSGGAQAGEEVTWSVPWLEGGASVQLNFVVTATDTLVNDDYEVTAAGGQVPAAKLTAHDKAFSDYFGQSVSVSGDRMIIGAYGDDERGYTDSGSAYIFERDLGDWNEEAKLVASDGAAYDYFGYSVALSGERVIVGAYADDDRGASSGSVYIFERDESGEWQQEAKLTAGDGSSNDYFGYSVAMSGNWAIVGAPYDDDQGSSSGSAYIFERDENGDWSQAAKLTAGDYAYSAYFGYSVAIDGDRVIVGAYNEDGQEESDVGSAYIFGYDGNDWQLEAKLIPPDGQYRDYFGYSVALSGERAIVGAYQDDDRQNTDVGSAYVFKRDGTSWGQEVKLTAGDGAAYDYFGSSVALSGDRAIVGAYGDDDQGNTTGAAYVFSRDANGWQQRIKLTASDGAANDRFGHSVAASGYTTIIGANQDDANTGAAYVFGPRRGQSASTVGEDTITTYIFDVTSDSPTPLDSATTLTSTLTAASSVTYTWAFGDGETLVTTEQVVTHTYPAVDVYQAMVTATWQTASGEASVAVTTTVVVEEAISELAAMNDSPTVLSETTTLSATIAAGSNVSYTWDLGDGNTATGVVVTHTYETTGTHTAIVTASNAVSVVSATTTITVDEAISGLGATSDSPTVLDEPTTLTATVQTGSNVTYEWAFGDGYTETIPSSFFTTTHTYPSVGVYTAVVTASNSVSVMTTTTTVVVDEPIAGLAAASNSPVELGHVSVLTATIISGTNVTYTWDLGYGQIRSGAVVTDVYPAGGLFTAVVTASNSVSLVTATTVVTIDETVAGLAVINDSPTGIGGLTSFTATITSGTNVVYTWDFGNGAAPVSVPRLGQTVAISYEYPAVGVYTAMVTASNSVNLVTATTVVYVDETISGLAATNSSPTLAGETTTLSATIETGTNVTYQWSFGDGATLSGPEAEVSHTYSATGTYTALVTASNVVNVMTATTTITVETAVNGLNVASDAPTLIGETTHLTATLTAGDNVIFTWDFGDGTITSLPLGGTEGGLISHTYQTTGTYSLVVTASNGVSAMTDTLTVTVEEAISGLTAMNDGPTELDDPTEFVATIATGSHVVYEWDLGNGQTASGAGVTYTYPEAGTYTAVVTASNGVSLLTATTTVTVEEVIRGLSVTNDSPTLQGDFTTLIAAIVAGDNVTYAWDLGDGATASGPIVAHTYPAAGFYTAILTASNSVDMVIDTTEIVIVGPVDAGQSQLIAVNNKTRAAADGADTINIRVTARDAFGSPIPNATVILTSTDAVSLTQPPPTGADGRTEGSATSSQVGSVQIRAVVSDTFQSEMIDDPVTVTFEGADLAVSKTGPAEIGIGQVVTYHLTIRNNGLLRAENVVLIDTMPTYLIYQGYTGQVAPTVNGSQLRWELGDLLHDESLDFTVVARLYDYAQPGWIVSNQVQANSDTFDENPDDNGTTVESTVRGAGLAVRKSGPSQAVPGQPILYNITVKNNGLISVEGVIVTDTLPLSITYLSHSALVTPTVGAPTTDGVPVTWELGNLGAQESIGFALVGRVTDTVTPGEIVQNQVEATALTQDEDNSNNVMTSTAQVISPYAHTLNLSPETVTARIGAVETLRLNLNNTGPLADAYTFTVNGLDPAWYTPIAGSFPLNPGGSTTAYLKLHVADCVFTGTVPFSVTAHAQEGEQAVTAEASLTLLPDPLQLDLAPANGSKSGARTVLFSWRTDAPTTGQLTLYPTLLPEQAITRTTALSTVHQMAVEDLSRNVEYTWFVESQSTCGQTTSSNRTFTVGNGLVFAQRSQNHIIHHDYNQQIEIEVRNEDLSRAHTLRVLLEQPYEDLIANFVGPGSVDDEEDYIVLEPGESRNVMLVAHTQDAEQEYYHLVAKVIANEGTADEIVDYAHITLRVLRGDQFSLTLVDEDPKTLVKTYRVTNEGLPITDLNIQAVDPNTGLPARALLQPTINHGYLDIDQSIEFQVLPLFSPEDAVSMQDIAAIATRPGLASPLSGVNDPSVQLIVNTGSISQTQTGTFGCQLPDQLYAVTWHDVRLSYYNGDWYCTNKPSINMNFNTHGSINPDDVLGATLSTQFKPWWGVRPHNAQLLINDHQVGSFSNTVPKGTYNFSVDPAYLNYTPNPVEPVNQTLSLHSQHPNGGHYVVNTSSQLDVFLENFTQYCCAANEEEAKVNCKLDNMQDAATEVDITIREPVVGSAIELGETVTLETEVVDDLDEDVSYPVQTVITYKDQIVDDNPYSETLELPYISSFSGIDTYQITWTPVYEGEVSIKANVNAVTATDTDSIDVTVGPEKPVRIEVFDPDGNPVSALSLNDDGWPTPNPLTVQVTLTCPTEGENCTGPFNLNLDFGSDPGRFYVYDATLNLIDLEENGFLCSGDVPNHPLQYSHTTYTLDCLNFRTLSAGSAISYNWQVWIQPSKEATLDISAAWSDASDSENVTIPKAEIHPVVFVHGIGGSMPPKNHVITQWPQQIDGINLSTEPHLDPFGASYRPLINNLLKMGYELDKTLLPVTYDWRNSNLNSAAYLSQVLEDNVGANNSSADKLLPFSYINHDGKADVIVHSMGGMVLRSYLQDMATTGMPANVTVDAYPAIQRLHYNGPVPYTGNVPYKGNVNKAVFIATPHRGFPFNYATWEGLTWKDYQDEADLLWYSGGLFRASGRIMDNLLWPFMIVERYNPDSTEEYCNLEDIPIYGSLETGFCPKEVLYKFSHSNPYDPTHPGIGSLPEMLPDASQDYLVPENWGRQPNFLLEELGLNHPTSLNKLDQTVGLDNVYVLYSDSRDTVVSFVTRQKGGG
jgi:uncharacterized repeat protein (TIGR01451 family)